MHKPVINKIIYKISFLLLSALFPFLVFAADSCYVELRIEEEKIGETIRFSLLEVKNLYGDYESFVKKYYLERPADYILKTYDSENLLEKYPLYSSRFILWDSSDEESPGGVIEKDAGIISTTIPYNQDINKITVENNNIETDLNVDFSKVICQRTCIEEDEEGSYDFGEKCCSGLIPASQADGSFVCVKCGDGICSEYEDRHSCPEDCGQKGQADHEPEEYGRKIFLVIGIIALSVLLIVACLIAFKILKKRKSGSNT